MTVKINTKFIKHMLVSLEINQQDLAKMSGITEQTLTRILRGESFTSTTLGKLAKALNCSPVDLIDNSDYPPPQVKS